MAISVVECWKGKGYRQADDGTWEAERYFNVFGTANEDEAVATLATAPWYAARNRTHPRYTTLLCSTVGKSEALGPMAMGFTAYYRFPKAGSFPSEVTQPLLAPIEITWTRATKSVPMEYDLDGRVVCNSAGFIPSHSLERPIVTRILQLRRYEVFWDLARAQALENHVNQTACDIGPMHVEPGQAYCHTYEPDGGFEEGTPFLKVLYEFEFDLNGSEPWQAFTVDKGQTGWTTPKPDASPVTGPFGVMVDNEFWPVNEDIVLDGTGKPVDSVYKVGVRIGGQWAGMTPIANPHINSYPCYQGILAGRPAWQRGWKRVAFADFGSLVLIR